MYDFIILGGGVAGLYTAYHILQNAPDSSLLILEKENLLGGRIDTFQDKHMKVEAGAGRFHEDQVLLLELLKELGLSNKIRKISGSASFAPIETPGQFMNSILDIIETPPSSEFVLPFSMPLLTPIFQVLLDIALGKQNIPNAELILQVILASKGEPKSRLQKMNFLTYAKQVLSPEQINFIEQSFGYYSELVIMNAYDAIYLMEKHLSPTHQFFVLQDGLSQIIENLEKEILRHKGAKILKQRRISSIQWSKSGGAFTVGCSNVDTTYKSRVCISALPKQVLEKIPIFRPVLPMLHKIECSPLCRIYSKFPLKEGEPWFRELTKLTTNNHLRMIIPYDESSGIIMSSYTDSKYARFWKQLFDKEGEEGVNRELLVLLKQSTGIQDIPMPMKTHVFFWECGVGYWGVGADSGRISQDMVKPIPELDLFICGEHFSDKNQQWIEGALETSQKVLDFLSL